MCDLLLNLRLRRVRDLLLCRDIVGPDIASTISEELYAKILTQQESVRILVSQKLQSASYEKEDEFWVDCTAFFNAISEAPQLKRSQYEYMVLCKQIMHESVAVENNHDSKVLDVQSQLKREAGGSTRGTCFQSPIPNANANDQFHPRLLSLAIHTLKGANKDAVLLDDSAYSNAVLDLNVRRVLTTLQSYTAGINSAYTGSNKRSESAIQPGRRIVIKNEGGAVNASSATVGSLSVRSREVPTSGSELNSEVSRGHVGKRYSDGKAVSSTLHDFAGTPVAAPLITLVGVTFRGREVRQSTIEDSSPGEYFARVDVEGCGVELGEYPSALNAARAHDRAYMRALGPRHCSPELLNFPAAAYSRDSMALFTIHDAALRSALWGTAWRGPQDCDFAFLIAQQPKRGTSRSAESLNNSEVGKLGKPTSEVVTAAESGKKSRNEIGSDITEESVRQDSWPVGPYVPLSELSRYYLPDFSKYAPTQSDTDSRRSCAVTRNQRYWNFDAIHEAPRCGDIPPIHCYILAQELLRSKSVLAAATVPEATKPEEVEWEPYSHPYTPREWEVLSAPKSSNATQTAQKLPVRWERCLQRNASCQRDLSNLRAEMKLALNVLEERQERLQEKRGGAIARGVLQGVRKLSSVHDVYVCSVQENVMDPLSRLSGSQDIEFGCFTYALEAALVREQIINPKGKAFGSTSKKRVASNFSHDEWEALRVLSGSISLMLKAHVKEKAK